MNLKQYAYDMRVLSLEDQRRGNPSGINMRWELFRQGAESGKEPLEGFDSGVDWAAVHKEAGGCSGGAGCPGACL